MPVKSETVSNVLNNVILNYCPFSSSFSDADTIWNNLTPTSTAC